MELPFFEFPTQDDWRRIYKASLFETIFNLVDEFEVKCYEERDAFDFFDQLEVRSYIYELRKRLASSGRGYILMMFYYEKGIPDQRWFISPGRDGKSIEYYPDFQERHFYIKGWFDFYSDILYFKLFSAWDTVGHVLNAKYNLKIKQVHFTNVIEALKSKDQLLHTRLVELTRADSYQKAKKIRNDLTHNYAPNIAGTAVFKPESHPIGITHVLGLKNYTTSDEIVANAQELFELFAETVEAMLKQ